MSSLFRLVLQMSITASYVIAAVIVFRMLLRNYPKKYSYYLWSVVLFRLCCPFSFSSVFSIFNFSLKKGEDVIIDLSSVPVSSGTETQNNASPIEVGAPEVTEAIKETFSPPALNTPVATAPSESVVPAAAKVDPGKVLLVVWIMGIIVLLTYALIKYLRMRKELRFSVPLRDNIRQADIKSPFLMGLIDPVIYVPFSSDDKYLEMSIAHEEYHIQRKDQWIRALSFCLLCIHWMNPLCWIAYYLMIKDMEMSCDEHVISGERDLRTTYSDALLSFATERKTLVAGSIDFGGSNVNERIKNVLRFKNANRMKSVFAALVCMLMLASCAFNGKIPANLEPTSSGNSSGSGYSGSSGGAPVSGKRGQMQSALGGAFGQWTVSTPEGVYYLHQFDADSGSWASSVVFMDTATNTQKRLSGSFVSDSETLLSDSNRDCLLTMSFSMDGGFVINRIRPDGSTKEEVVRLPGYVQDYFDRNYIQTKGSKLYIPLRKGESRELVEIDVDAGTAKTVYTFDNDQTVIGGFNNCIVFRTGKASGTQQNDAFSPSSSYRFDLFDIETGETELLMEADLPYVTYYSGHNILSMTWEGDRFVTHIYNLGTGKETTKELTVVPEFLMDEPNRTIKWITLGEPLDDTHFALGYCEFEMEGGRIKTDDGWPVYRTTHYCVVDAENGTAVSYDQVFATSDARIPGDSVVFAETDSTIYFTARGSKQVIYAVPRDQFISGSVDSISVIHEITDTENTEPAKAEPVYGEIDTSSIPEGMPVPVTGDERDMSWPVGKCLNVWRVPGDDYAVDFISHPGMEAISAYMGVVTAYGHDDDWGTYLILSHGGGITTVYCHLLDVEVQLGQIVAKGDVIGYIGEKADDLGSHLEFRIFVDGEKADPEDYLATYMNSPLFTD